MPQSKWEAIVKEKINKCNMVIVLSGKTMASATGVAKEIAMAKNRHVPVFSVYVGGAEKTSNLPKGLQRNRTIKWNWDDIASAIDQLKTEGKKNRHRDMKEALIWH